MKKLTNRVVNKAYNALQEISLIRTGGLKQSEDGDRTYVGRLAMPRRAKMRIRALLRVLSPMNQDYLDQRQEMVTEANRQATEGDKSAMGRLSTDLTDLLNMEVMEFPENVKPLSATDIGDEALDHIPPSLLVDLGPFFVDDEDEDEGAGDPRNREERRGE